MKPRKRVVMEKLSRLGKGVDDFDFRFWKKVGIQGKFSAAWEMVLDLNNWGKKRVYQPRLQRSVAALKSRRR